MNSIDNLSEHEIYELMKLQDDLAWRLVWEKAVLAEAKSLRSSRMAREWGVTPEELMGILYEEMIAKGKIELFRDDGGSLMMWMRAYVRGYITRSDPAPHGEFSLEGTAELDERGEPMAIPFHDHGFTRNEVWQMTHLCFRDLWNDDPRKAYVLLFKTRFFLSSREVADLLEIPSEAAVDQIFSRAVKDMRAAWPRHDKEG